MRLARGLSLGGIALVLSTAAHAAPAGAEEGNQLYNENSRNIKDWCSADPNPRQCVNYINMTAAAAARYATLAAGCTTSGQRTGLNEKQCAEVIAFTLRTMQDGEAAQQDVKQGAR
ncbi:hypothetical protein NRB36_004309 [Salmonella enterica]|nr:hypothetical protein [Salmonella enterica]EJO1639668.1 hypothetical protein [Salmonella enterica]